jgi:hypothetical protein
LHFNFKAYDPSKAHNTSAQEQKNTRTDKIIPADPRTKIRRDNNIPKK